MKRMTGIVLFGMIVCISMIGIRGPATMSIVIIATPVAVMLSICPDLLNASLILALMYAVYFSCSVFAVTMSVVYIGDALSDAIDVIIGGGVSGTMAIGCLIWHLIRKNHNKRIDRYKSTAHTRLI